MNPYDEKTGNPPDDLREPLGESAAVARELANRHCDRSDSESSCLLYHSTWQYFRLIGLIKTIRSDDDFLGPVLEELAATGRFDRVLISGSADYGMLARVIHAYRRAGRTPAVTLVDICRTPLELNRWLADREGLALQTIQSDILQFSPDRPYDLICTHSFLGRFHGQRTDLIRTWRNALRPGGRVVTTTRVRPGITDIVHFSSEEVESFTVRARRLAETHHDLLDVDPETIATWAQEYAQRKFNYPLETCDEVVGYFTQAGLAIDRLDIASTEGDRPSGPSRGLTSERVRIIAVRQ